MEFAQIVERTGCTAAQVIFQFACQAGMLPLTGTTDPAHMREDLDSVKCVLTAEDLRLMEKIRGVATV